VVLALGFRAHQDVIRPRVRCQLENIILADLGLLTMLLFRRDVHRTSVHRFFGTVSPLDVAAASTLRAMVLTCLISRQFMASRTLSNSWSADTSRIKPVRGYSTSSIT